MAGIYIPDMTIDEYEELRKYAKYGANNAMIGSKEAIPVPDHGRLVDADALIRVMSNYDWGHDSYWDEAAVDLVCDSPTIIPADI